MNQVEKDEMQRIKKALEEQVRSDWITRLDERQRRLVANARMYAANDPAGLPGHNLMLIIDKLAALLDEYEPVNALSKYPPLTPEQIHQQKLTRPKCQG